MDSAKSPSEVARETLKLLAARRLSPTPDNYQALYEEVSGVRTAPNFPTAQLRHILHVMPGQTPGRSACWASWRTPSRSKTGPC